MALQDAAMKSSRMSGSILKNKRRVKEALHCKEIAIKCNNSCTEMWFSAMNNPMAVKHQFFSLKWVEKTSYSKA